MALPDKDMMAAIAATRFGLGAKPGEIAAAKADPSLVHGFNTVGGHVTNAAVAEFLGVELVDPLTALER